MLKPILMFLFSNTAVIFMFLLSDYIIINFIKICIFMIVPTNYYFFDIQFIKRK